MDDVEILSKGLLYPKYTSDYNLDGSALYIALKNNKVNEVETCDFKNLDVSSLMDEKANAVISAYTDYNSLSSENIKKEKLNKYIEMCIRDSPIPVGTFKLNITEVCFGDSTVTLAPGATTVAGKALTPTSVFTSSHNLLNRSSVSTAGLSSCCQQCMGTTLDYSQAATTATVTAPAGCLLYTSRCV